MGVYIRLLSYNARYNNYSLLFVRIDRPIKTSALSGQVTLHDVLFIKYTYYILREKDIHKHIVVIINAFRVLVSSLRKKYITFISYFCKIIDNKLFSQIAGASKFLNCNKVDHEILVKNTICIKNKYTEKTALLILSFYSLLFYFFVPLSY